MERARLRSRLFAGIGASALLLCLYPITALAQSPVQQVQKSVHTAEKKAVKLVKTARRSTRKAGRKVTATAGRAARVATATANKVFANPAWETLRSAYDYDGAAPEVKEEAVADANAMILKISFTGPNGQPVEGLFLRPKEDGVYPCALLPHGLSNNKEIAIKMFGNALVAKGIAVLALDAPGHGTGQSPNKNYWNQDVITLAVHEGNRNYRRALDYLATRIDIDQQHIGLLGYSLGSIMGSILGAVDERVTAFSFCVGGDPFLPVAKTTVDDKARRAILQVCPSLFIGHLKGRPIIMFNGLTDVVVVPPAAKLLQIAAPEPKQIVWYNGGHDVPQEIRTRAVNWLANQLAAPAAGQDQPQEKPQKPADKPADPPRK